MIKGSPRRSLHAALESQYAAYPETPRLAETLQAVAHDKVTLDVLLGCSWRPRAL